MSQTQPIRRQIRLNKKMLMKQFLTAVIGLLALTARAQPGTLDNSFGVSGVAMSPFVTQYSYGHDLAIQPDGKILVTGHLDISGIMHVFVARYHTDGTIDSTFANPVTGVGNTEYARAITLQPDGKILVAGYVFGITGSDFLLIRFLPDGTYDHSFGQFGIVVTSLPGASMEEAYTVAVQPDGKILVAGVSVLGNHDLAMVRYLPNGNVDTSFGANGVVTVDDAEAHEVLLQPDGKILVAGFTQSTTTANDVAVFRFHADGSPDLTFGVNGLATVPANPTDDDAAFAMALQPDGKIVTAGYTYTQLTYADNLIVRFDSTGNPDLTFNSTGFVVSNSTGNDHISYGALVQPDGKIIITGRAWQLNANFHLSRFNSGGSIDLSFGTAGNTYTNIALEDDFILASRMQSDGKIVVTGYYTDSGIENFVVARYLNDSIFSSVSEYASGEPNLWPQPASKVLHVRIKDNGRYYIALYSCTSLLYKKEMPAEFSLDVSNLPDGIYFMSITDNETHSQTGKKIVVQH